ncbi:MAG: ROK family protein [Candidatus Aminicenantes bacterium]|nr:ROK family protein [Candidatus Aminicenantes bacterium]
MNLKMPLRFKESCFPKIKPPLDPSFLPACLWNRSFRQQVAKSASRVSVKIALEREAGSLSTWESNLLDSSAEEAKEANLFYVERIVKNLLWMRGGWRLFLKGPSEIIEPIALIYSQDGARAFDVDLMTRAYLRPFEKVVLTKEEDFPIAKEKTKPLGGHLDGYRLGFDLGASDWKVAALAEGEVLYTAEFPWSPSQAENPNYHFHHLQAALHLAAAHLPKVEAIGGSAAGIYINNEPRVASLFRRIPPGLFDREIRPLFHRLQNEWKVPLEVANDGEVAALAGCLVFKVNKILAISMGSSEAGGYVNQDGYITDWLNELAFAPVDYCSEAPVDEWSGDRGCGVQYFSQQAVFRLAKIAGLGLDETLPPTDRLKQIQTLLERGEEKARLIFETIGAYLGYAVAHYSDFYDLNHVFILGRVTSGEAGSIIAEMAQRVLHWEFPELSEKIKFHLPDERIRRLGQAVAAATLPLIAKKDLD